MALPAVIHGEWASMPLNVFAGIAAGQLRQFAPEQEDIWSFSPFIDFSIYRWIRRNLPRPRVFDWQVAFFRDDRRLAIFANRNVALLAEFDLWSRSPGYGGGRRGTLNAYLVESAIYLTAW